MKSIRCKLAASEMVLLTQLANGYSALKNLSAEEADVQDTAQGPSVKPKIPTNEIVWRDMRVADLYAKLRKLGRWNRKTLPDGAVQQTVSFLPERIGDMEFDADLYEREFTISSEVRWGAFWLLVAVMTPKTERNQIMGTAGNLSVFWQVAAKLRLDGHLMKHLKLEDVKLPQFVEPKDLDEAKEELEDGKLTEVAKAS